MQLGRKAQSLTHQGRWWRWLWLLLHAGPLGQLEGPHPQRSAQHLLTSRSGRCSLSRGQEGSRLLYLLTL